MSAAKKLAAALAAAVDLIDVHVYGGLALLCWGIAHPEPWAIVAGAGLFYLGRRPVAKGG